MLAMKPHRASSLAPLAIGLMTTFLVGQASAYNPKFCSKFNTGDSGSLNDSIYQSYGNCDGHCREYAYAILRDHECWCSNLTPDPSTNVNMKECNTSCPGYPDDTCGKAGDYYLYLARNISPSGTKGPGPATSSKADPPQTSTRNSPPTTLQISSTVAGSTTAVGGGVVTATATKPEVFVSTITTGGMIQTVTVTPTPSASPPPTSNKSGLSTQAAVGIGVGVTLAGLAVCGLVLFFWWRKRSGKHDDKGRDSACNSGTAIIPAMAEDGQGGRRGSKFIPIDDRMEYHHGIYIRGEGRPSTETLGSLQDNVDYSRRVLRPTNPDPA